MSEIRTADQLRLVAHLRWRVFVNSLRTRRGKAELAGRSIAGLFIGTGVLGVGVLLALASWSAFRRDAPLLLAAALWLVFLVWQLLPIFITGFVAQSDSSLLLRFPLRYSTFLTLTLAYGLADPVSIAALYWLAMILAGIAAAKPSALVWAFPTVLVFAGMNVLLSRCIFAWLDRWLARRRTREVLGIIFFLAMMSLQLCGPISRKWSSRVELDFTRVQPIQRFFPPGLAANAVESGSRGATGAALVGLAGVLAFAGIFGWLLGIRLQAQYRGENLGETPREQSQRITGTRSRGWRIGGLSPALAALLQKDSRYLLRNTAQYLALALPLILVSVFSLNGGGGRHPIFSGAAFFPMSIAYCILVVSGPAYNSLGYDGAGLAMLFAAPVRFRDVLLSKNLLHGLLVSVEILLVSILVSFLSGPPSALVMALTFAGALFVIFLNFAVGNLLTLYFPRKLQFGTMRRQGQSGIAALATILVPGTAMGIATGVYAICDWLGHRDWAVFALVGLAGASFVAYRRVLGAVSTIADRKRDVLIGELSKGQ